MGIPPDRPQGILKLKEGRARQTHDLLPPVDEMDAVNTHGVDQNDATVVIAAIRRRPTRQARVRSLHDHNLVAGNTGFQHSPLFDETTRANHRNHWTMSETKAGAKPSRATGTGQDVGVPDNFSQCFDQDGVIWKAHITSVS